VADKLLLFMRVVKVLVVDRADERLLEDGEELHRKRSWNP
jgi:hypothetical protein